MRSLPTIAPFLSLLLPHVVFGFPSPSLDCGSHDGKMNVECSRPMKAVSTVTPGAYYVAKVPCPECEVLEWSGKEGNRTSHLVQQENDLLFNISLTRDHRTLLLNGQPIFPKLSTNPHPPYISTPQITPNYTRNDLSDTLACARKCHDSPQSWGCECITPLLSTVTLDYEYYSKWLSSHPETQTEKWEVTFDAIGGTNGGAETGIGSVFDSAEQSVLRIIMQGRELENQNENTGGHNQAASPLTGGYQEPETQYEYEIASIEFSQRYTSTPHTTALGLFSGLKRFFGTDVTRADGHIVYLAEEWGSYGKKGSLRQGFGIVVHEWRWDIVFAILGFVLLGLSCLWFAWWLFFAVKKQRELARWDGMDQVWARMRRGGEEDGGFGDEEDAQLLEATYRDNSRDEGYRDEPSERPPKYSDEVQTNKPLPSKPLPEKPLPAVPLIDT